MKSQVNLENLKINRASEKKNTKTMEKKKKKHISNLAGQCSSLKTQEMFPLKVLPLTPNRHSLCR